MTTKSVQRSTRRADAEPVASSSAKRSSNSSRPKKATTAAVKAAKKPAAKSAPKPASKTVSKKVASRKEVLIEDIELIDDSETVTKNAVAIDNGDIDDVEVEIEVDEDVIEEVLEAVVAEVIDYNDRNTVLFTERNRVKADIVKATSVPERRRSAVQQRRIGRLMRELDDVTTQIVKFNYGLVRSYTKKFTSNSSREDSADFEASAVVGLMRAIDSFDPTKGRFGAWAYKPIQREVLRAVRDADFKSMNPGDFERRPDILRAVVKLQAGDDTKMPTNAAVAAEARVTVDQVRRVLEAPHLESIHQHVGDDGGTELGDLIESDTTRVEGAVLSSMTLTALEDYGFRSLDERELFVLVRRFGLDSEPEQKLASIGDMLGLSREAVRQVESKALAKLMHPTVLRKIVRYGRA